jgi:hypothetical protein
MKPVFQGKYRPDDFLYVLALVISGDNYNAVASLMHVVFIVYLRQM